MDIQQILQVDSPEDIRSCLYYAARYFKQAESFENYKKDIFQDEGQNAPPIFIVEATLRLIEAVEGREGVTAEHFDDETFMRLMNEITSLEASLSTDLTEDEIARGATLAAEMIVPLPALSNKET